MKKVKIIALFLIVTFMTLSISTIVSAETLFAYHTEWYNGRYFYEGSSMSMKYGVVMKIDTYNMHSNWTNKLTAAMNSWSSTCGDYFTYTITTSSPTVTYIGNSSAPAWFPPGWIGFTHLQDTYGVWHINWSNGNTNNFAPYFKYADIIINKTFDTATLTANDRQKTLTHEMGHVAQLGHPVNANVNSVMHQGQVSGNIQMTVQTKDKNDLINIYN
jgi:hypothetical protein